MPKLASLWTEVTEGDRNQRQTKQLDLRQCGPGYLPGSGSYWVIKPKLGVSGSKLFRKYTVPEKLRNGE